MRTPLLATLAALVLCAGCGQKGPLVLPQKTVATPVVIRAPAAPAAAPAPAPAEATTPAPAPKKDDEAPSPKRR